MMRNFNEIKPGDVVTEKSGARHKVVLKFSVMDPSIDYFLLMAGLGRTDLLYLGVEDVRSANLILYEKDDGKFGCYAYGRNSFLKNVD